MKLLIFSLFLFSAWTGAQAAKAPVPGEYTGTWVGRVTRGRDVEEGTMRMIVSTNGGVIVLMRFIFEPSGAVYDFRLDGTVQRNGILRGADLYGAFRAVSRAHGHSIRGRWLYPKHDRLGMRLRFYANHD